METNRQQAIAPAVVPAATNEGFFDSADLPAQWREEAANRLGVLSLLSACTFILFGLLHAIRSIGNAPPHDRISAIASASVVLLGFVVFAFSRRKRFSACALLDVGVAYQLLMALAIGFLDHLGPLAEASTIALRGWSGVSVWIIVFAVFVPSAPRRTLWVSAAAALMDPIGMLLTSPLGNTMPSSSILPLMFAPTLVAVFTAVVAARVSQQLGKRIRRAEDLGSYQLVEKLGQGGMGEVWRAEHRMLARPAAIKLIRSDALRPGGSEGHHESGEQLLRRFEREARATASLESEHTIRLYDFGVAKDGSFYYVMELLDGLDLEVLVQKSGPLPVARAVFLLEQICDALEEAHARGLVHRDIKPANIYICRRALDFDVVKVLDFGLVKATGPVLKDQATLTVEGAISGTPAYMVPEIAQGDATIDGRADLYALGCVAYWMLSGSLVFDGPTPLRMILDHTQTPPPPLSKRSGRDDIPAALETLIHACLQKDPAQRPASAQVLAEELAQISLPQPWDQRHASAWWKDRSDSAPLPVNPMGETGVDPAGETLADPQRS